MYPPSPEPKILWDPPGWNQGVTIERVLNGKRYAERIPHNGLVTQSLAAQLLGVSLMSINNWARAGKLKHIKVNGQPSVIPFAEVKRIKAIRERDARLMARQRGR
jgi:excisionase family DNA binding protein